MNGNTQETCPICGRHPANVRRNDLDEEITVDCGTCGIYRLGEDALPEFRTICRQISNAKALISYCIHQTQRSNKRPLIDDNLLRAFVDHNTLPSPPEQGDNLIRELGSQLKGADPGRLWRFNPEDVKALIGASSAKGVRYVVEELHNKGLINSSTARDWSAVRLTFPGWERYSELQRAHSEGPIAFMAMPFNVPELDDVYLRCFRSAVQATGFELRRLDEKPPAGLIDVRMEVEIRRSRFLVAELTNGNKGVYWEAGFAEGLGKPVIYTCEKAYFQKNRSHFDTDHRHTIVWQTGELDRVGEELKNTIRATLPSEAKMFDDT
jgi:hypothetical protein